MLININDKEIVFYGNIERIIQSWLHVKRCQNRETRKNEGIVLNFSSK